MQPASKYLLAFWVLFLLWQRGGVDILPTPTPKAESLHGVIVEETGERQPWFGALTVKLRNSPLPTGVSRLDIIDDESIPAQLKAGIGQLESIKLPCLFILDGKTKQQVYFEPVPETATVEQIHTTLGEYVK